MTEYLTAAQMRTIEMAAIESGEVSGLALMERAGEGVVEAVVEEWPELAGGAHHAVVLCGPGNNGGDGFVVARLLKTRGWQVEVFFYGDADRLPPDAKVNYGRWRELGEVHQGLGRVYEEDGALRGRLLEADVVLDALFGTGLTRGLGAIHTEIWQAFDLDTGPIHRLVAVDIPSGVCADSGRILGMECQVSGRSGLPSFALIADLTVSFHREKHGHRIGEGPEICGKTVVKSIGLETLPSSRGAAERLSGELLRAAKPGQLGKATGSHKYAHGHALILSGGAGRTGAARLAARGALRIGAGLVTLGVPGAALMEVASHVTAVMVRRAGRADELAGVLQDVRFNALCLGPGLGVERARDLVPVALSDKNRAVVLDADALSAFEGEPETLFSLCRESRSVLTPHGGEFRRVFPDLADKLSAPVASGPAYSKVDATREAAARAGCVVLFKGADTVIAAPDGACVVNSAAYDRAAPWLATAGSGDVLAGFITGLLARGLAPMDAAQTGAWLHVECARAFGPGLIAEDLPEGLPKLFRSLGGELTPRLRPSMCPGVTVRSGEGQARERCQAALRSCSGRSKASSSPST
ncbi:MAG: bifunctional ADP-dependent NAD(P)H-hydrate dehydratase/NAD(P)H-hydrate epimerase [Rhodobacterales bacterium]|nr:MAG: bifunctional ADP-dependent NAD(P)H-hydrate dehydratase/NAD(P)H-hydrate epimerase [Rhodobacterales bacterium]